MTRSKVADVDRIASILPTTPLLPSWPVYVPEAGAARLAQQGQSQEEALTPQCIDEVARILQQIDCGDVILRSGCVFGPLSAPKQCTLMLRQLAQVKLARLSTGVHLCLCSQGSQLKLRSMYRAGQPANGRTDPVLQQILALHPQAFSGAAVSMTTCAHLQPTRAV